MVNYQDGKIYKLVCNVTNLVYIGSTCEPQLARRLAGHVGNYKKWRNGKYNFVTSFKVLEGDNYDIILIKNVKCNNKEELHAEERKVIESTNCVNKVIPTRTNKQYKQDNQDKISEQMKQYRNNNKEKLRDHMKKYYEDNQDKIKQYYKEWYEANQDKILEQQKQYYELNKAKLSEKTDCQCGGRYDQTHKSRHIKSSKHQNFLNKIQ